MTLDQSWVGRKTPIFHFDYDWRDVVRYALSVGAEADELDLLYEKRGPKVLPTFAAVPSGFVFYYLYDKLGGNTDGIVHSGQYMEFVAPYPPEGSLVTSGSVAAMYDLRRFAQVVFESETRSKDGTLLSRAFWEVLYRYDGGFGGAAPPRSARHRPPSRDPEFRVEQTTSRELALLYRLNGDLNPLHADPEVARQVGFDCPILHGLCTYAFAGRIVMKHMCEGNPLAMRSFSAQFRKPVYPGETLVVEGWREQPGIILRVSTKEAPDEPVLTQACVEIS